MHHLLLLLAILSLSQAANIVRWAGAPVSVIGTWRLLGASLVMLLICWLSKGKLQRLTKKQALWTLLSGALLYVHLWTYMFSAQNTLIANAMVIFATNPLWTALLTVLMRHQSMTRQLALSLTLSMTAIWIMFADKINFQGQWSIGDLTALASAFLYSFYMIASLKARQSGLSNKQFTFWIYAISGLCFALTGWGQQANFTDYPTQTWIALIMYIVFPTLLGHALLTYLLEHININWISTAKLAEPALSALVAWMAFGEELQPLTLLAFTLIIISLLNLYRPWKYLGKKSWFPLKF